MKRPTKSQRYGLGAVAGLALAAASVPALGAPPPKPSEGVPAPGRSVASGDDTTSIAVNPANLAFLPEAELRWSWVFTQSAAPLPLRGHAFGVGLPLWILATGLRVDLMDPPDAAPVPFTDNYQWVRWAFAVRGGDTASFGTTMSWSNSSNAALDGAFSLTSGVTLRPFSWISASAVFRDWNQPTSRTGVVTERSYDLGIATRPIFGYRDLEIGADFEYFEDSEEWVPKATLGIDVPRLGRIRGEVSALDLDTDDPDFVALAGIELNEGPLQVSGGGVFGDGLTKNGTGFYAGVAVRGYREPGLRMPARVARIRVDATPSTRTHPGFLRRLWRLQEDPEVEGVLLIINDEPAGSLAHAEEVGDAIRGIRARGKKVICHIETGQGRALYACSQADRIVMNPVGGLRFSGLTSQYFYLAGIMDKLGVQADFVRIGQPKLAPEQFTRTGPSDYAKIIHQDLVDEYSDIFLHDVGGGRQIPVSVLRDTLTRGPFVAREAREENLIDALAYEDEQQDVVEEVMGGPVRIVDDNPLPEAPRQWGNPDKVAIVYVHGNMIDGESRYFPFINIRIAGSQTIKRALQRARDDTSVKAVVLRVESSGGSTLAADVMLREAQLLAKEKPLVVSMGTVAASGGYWVSVAGDPIFANRTTLTGSIGVFYGKADLSGLLDKLGIGVATFRSSPRADAESLFRPFTDDEREALGGKVKHWYDQFIGRVSEGRDMTPEQVDAVARGRVWSGQQALEHGLVDRIGGMRQALAEARKQADLPDDVAIVELPPADDSLLGFLLSMAGFGAAAAPQFSLIGVIPPDLLAIAGAMAPFTVYESGTPLALAEHYEMIEVDAQALAED